MSDSTEKLNDLLPLSPDHNAERLAALKRLFPDLFTNEGRLNVDELKKVVDPALVSETERYDFRWYGKTASKREAFTPSRAALVYEKTRSVNPDKAGGNMIIEGENLEVLKLLSSAYRERIKCIYIDPPYNTGKDFVYSDRFTEGQKPYWAQTGVTEDGVKVDTNTDSDGRFHSNWLSMIHSRLLVARYLLRKDGVIFVSIADHEVQNLRRVMDDVFGQENFVAEITVLCNPKGRSQDKYFATNHEYLIVYSKEPLPKGAFAIAKDEDQIEAEYPEEDDDGKYRLLELRNTHREFGKHNRRNLYYPFYVSTEGEVFLEPADDREKVLPNWEDGFEGCWTWEKPKAEKDGAFLVGHQVNGKWKVYRKSYASGADRMLKTILTDKTFFTERGQKEFNILFNSKAKIFQAPKSPFLLAQLFQTATGENDIVLDFFGGSGTTAQAVMELNKSDGCKRQFILAQIPELTVADSPANKAGFKKISEITIERAKRVITRFQKEAEGLLPGDPQREFADGLGFKVFKLVKSSFPRVEFAPDPDKTEPENIELLKQYIRDKEATFHIQLEKETVLVEVLLKNGFMLDYTLTPRPEFTKNEVFLAKDAHKESLVCLDATLESETVDHFKKHKDLFFICLELALDTTKKWNLKHHLGDKLKAF
jgi:adenine-specific DNA-methyltransferase